MSNLQASGVTISVGRRSTWNEATSTTEMARAVSESMKPRHFRWHRLARVIAFTFVIKADYSHIEMTTIGNACSSSAENTKGVTIGKYKHGGERQPITKAKVKTGVQDHNGRWLSLDLRGADIQAQGCIHGGMRSCLPKKGVGQYRTKKSLTLERGARANMLGVFRFAGECWGGQSERAYKRGVVAWLTGAEQTDEGCAVARDVGESA